MTEKQKYALDKIMTALSDDCQESSREIAEYAVSLGYMPKIMGPQETYVEFIKSKIKRSILKIAYNSDFSPIICLCFFALPKYSGIFLS